MRFRLPYIMLFTVLLSLSSAAWACPLCVESLPSAQTSKLVPGPDGQMTEEVVGQPALAEGFAISIALMLIVPYAMVLSIGGYLYYRVRARKAQNFPTAA